MIAGRLANTVELYRVEINRDNFGAETSIYTLSKRVRADIKFSNGSVNNEVGELFHDVKIEVLIRDAHEVGEKWRVKADGITYNIAAIEHNRRKGFKRLICTKVNG